MDAMTQGHRMTADVELALKHWREVTAPLDHKSIDHDAELIASHSRFLVSPSVHTKEQLTKTTTSTNTKSSCRAWSHADFLQRVSSFAVATWFAKPDCISPLECARFGWTNTAPDMLTCLSCEKLICCTINAKLSASGADAVAQTFAHELESAHDDTCPWKHNPSPVSFTMLPVLGPSQVGDAFMGRAEKLLDKATKVGCLEKALQDVVVDAHTLEATFNPENPGSWITLLQKKYPTCNKDTLHTATILSICGWSVSDATAGERVVLSCEYCNRHAPLTLPPSQATMGQGGVVQEQEEAIASPLRKRAKISSSSSSSSSRFDPIGNHRWFCPWIVPQRRHRTDDDRMRVATDMSLPAHRNKTSSSASHEFIGLPGWKQYALAVKELQEAETSSSIVHDPMATLWTPQDALTSIQSVLALPDSNF